MTARVFYATLIPFFGWYADIYSLTQTLSIMGITTLASGGILMIILHKYKLI
jgi:hypothetical protein